MSNLNPETEGKLPKRGPGRPKGVPNKFTGDLRAAILASADSYEDPETGKRGVIAYLEQLRDSYPKSYCGLLARIIPQITQISGDPSLPAIRISFEKPDDSPKD
jgi:hypothetical protein